MRVQYPKCAYGPYCELNPFYNGVYIWVEVSFLYSRRVEHNRIYHHTVEGTRESHPSVHDLQSTTRLIFLPRLLFLIDNHNSTSFKLYKAQCHGTAPYGNVMR